MADGPVGPILVVVSAPSLQLFLRIRKRQEPVGVQAFRPQASIEGLDEGIVGRLAGAGEVERDTVGIGPQIKIARDELGSLIDPDRLRIAHHGADLLEPVNDVLGPIAEARINDRGEPGERVDDRQHPDLLPRRQLVVNKIHRPGLVRLDGVPPIVPELGLDPPLRRLVPELQSQLIVNPMSSLGC